MKNKFFILFITIFCIFTFSDKVSALSFNVNDVDYQVTDTESLRDYCYFKYVKDNSSIKDLFVFYNTYNNKYYCLLFPGNLDYLLVSDYLHFKELSNFNSFTNNNFYSYNSSFGNETHSTYYGSSVPINRLQSGYFHTFNVYNSGNSNGTSRGSLYKSSNFSFSDIVNKYYYNFNINYYLNNDLYYSITVGGGSSHTLKDNPDYNSSTQYWSGWTFDSNIDLSNINQDVNIYGTISDKPIYKIRYYINNELYHTDNVIEGDSYGELYSFTDFNSYTHLFSGWSYSSDVDFTNVRQDVDINGTLTEKDKIPVYVDFPITKKEFYSLEFMFGILLTMLILKWFFPFKMGGDYK